MGNVEERLDQVPSLTDEELRVLGEDARQEAERLCRSNPSLVPDFLAHLRQAGEKRRSFLPWCLWAEGVAEHGRGNTGAALTVLQRAASWFRRRDDQHAAARIDLVLMDAYLCVGRLQAAFRRGNKALAEFTARKDQPRMVSALINLGGAEESRNNIVRALGYWKRARRLVAEDDLLRTGLIDTCLARAMQLHGRFSHALQLGTSGASHLERWGAHATSLVTRLGCAEIEALLGNYPVALEMIDSIQDQANELEDYNVQFEIHWLRGRIELELGHPDRVRASAQLGQQLATDRGRLDEVGRFAGLLAQAAVSSHDPEASQRVAEAEELLSAAGLVVTAAGLRAELAAAGWPVPWPRLLRDAARLDGAGMKVLADIARVTAAYGALDEGHMEDARHLCTLVLQRRQPSVWPRVRALYLLAVITADREPTKAIRLLRRARTMTESVRGRLPSPGDREAVTQRSLEMYQLLVELLLRRGDSRSRREAFELVSRVKSRSLLEALDRRCDLAWQRCPGLVQQWNQMRRQLAAMLQVIEHPQGEHARYAASVLRSTIRTLSRQMENVELELSRSLPAWATVLGSRDQESLTSRLLPHELFLELFLTGSDLVIFCLTQTKLTAIRFPQVRNDVEQLVRAVDFQLSKAAFGRRSLEQAGDVLVGQARSLLARLGELVLAPLTDQPLPEQLYVAPHGPLHHLPFAALELGGGPLVELCPVAVEPGSKVLSHLLSRPHALPRRLALAGSAPVELVEIVREISELSQTLEGAHVTQAATVADVTRLLQCCDAVHVAAHGAFQPLFPAASGIRLEDGWLTVLDLLQLQISARLVSFGVCTSGRVTVGAGDELTGVVRALLAAGVETALLAPGVLDDEIARQAALSFFGTVLDKGPGAALQETLHSLRSEHPHPSLWAGLQLYGNPRPWEECS